MEFMSTVYLVCAIVGGTLLACQFLLTLFGGGDHHDAGGHDVSHDFQHDAGGHHHTAGHDTEGSWLVGLITFRTLVAAVTFFGLTGLATAQRWGEDNVLTLLVSLAAGALAMIGVARLLYGLQRLRTDGTVHITRAVGAQGTVYLSIPGQKGGAGKVHLCLQNRTVEYQAVTAADPLPSGTRVVVLSVVGADTVEVAPFVESLHERTAHA